MGYYSGTSGNDSLEGGADKDWLYGYMGDDTLVGGADRDWLDAHDGNDSLVGGEGSDTLIGGEGSDTLIGGEGSDRFGYLTYQTNFSPVNLGVDVISDFETGSDKIVLNKSIFTSISSTVGLGFSLLGEFATVTSDADAATSTADIVYNSVNGNLYYNPNGSESGLGTGALLATLTGAPTLVATDFIIDFSPLSLNGGAGNDTINGGAGDDYLYGFEGNDSLYGSEGQDYLDGGAGDDTLDGGAGNDYLNGGYEGNDFLDGGAGDDTLAGGVGDDTLNGGAGDDYLYGNEGNDSFYGSEGNDFFYDSEGNDYLDGGNGNDSLDSGNGNDFLVGGEGNDSLDGGESNDALIGGVGDDTLKGGAGDDFFMGGQGSDRFIYSRNWMESNLVSFGLDIISDFETGSDKIVLDKSFFHSISSPVGTGLGSGEFSIVTSDTDAATSTADIVYNSVNGKLFYNPNGSEFGFGTGTLLLTLTGAPTLVATDFQIEASPLWLNGGAGNDSLVGGEANDNIFGYDGNDTLVGLKGDDTLYGDNGNDILVGWEGNDYLNGGYGNDILVGWEGNDYLNDWWEGDDSLYGWNGNDTLNAGNGNDYLEGGNDHDILYGKEGNDSLLGENGNDFLDGWNGFDALDGGNGNDFLNGGNGIDILKGGDGDDSLKGGNGDDVLIGGLGSDRFLYSRNWMDGTESNLVSFGLDVISDFETGSDKIVLDKSFFHSVSSPVGTGLGSGEFATVTSDADAATSTADIVYNSVNGKLFYNPNGSEPGLGTGTLLLTLTGAPTLVATDFQIEASPVWLNGGVGNDSLEGGEMNDYIYGNDGNDTLVGWEGNDSLEGGNGNDFLVGGEGDDKLSDWEGNDSLLGGDGHDILNGSYGNDTLLGGDGHDILSDWEGDDSLNGGNSNDSLNGGEGSDRFVYSTESLVFNPANFGVDVIFDFQTGTDKIVLNKTTFNSISSSVSKGLSGSEEFAIVTSDVDAATSTADIVYNSVNGNLFYNANGSDSGFGTGALFATLTSVPTLVATDFILEASPLWLSGTNDNDSLVGGDGNDFLYGYDGNDILTGGDGDDNLYGNNDNDTLIGGEGSDRFHAVYERIFNSEYFGVDVISDFETGSDKIVLNKWIFTSIDSAVGTGFSLSEEFAVVESDADAAISTAEIVYNSSNGNLYYNTNGSEPGLGTGSLFATLTGAPTLVATDFFILQPYNGKP